MWILPHTDNTHTPGLLAIKLQSDACPEVLSPHCTIHVHETQQQSFFLAYLREKSVLSLHTGCAEPKTSKVEHFRVASC